MRPSIVITDREQSLLIEHYCPGCQLHPVPVTFIINQSYLSSYWSSQPVPGCYWSVVAANSHHPDLIRAAGAVRYGDRRTSSVPLPQLEIVTQPGGGQAELGIRTLTGSDTFLILSGDLRLHCLHCTQVLTGPVLGLSRLAWLTVFCCPIFSSVMFDNDRSPDRFHHAIPTTVQSSTVSQDQISSF